MLALKTQKTNKIYQMENLNPSFAVHETITKKSKYKITILNKTKN